MKAEVKLTEENTFSLNDAGSCFGSILLIDPYPPLTTMVLKSQSSRIKKKQFIFLWSNIAMELVTPGQTITTEPGFLRGHGTYVLQGNLIASVAGNSRCELIVRKFSWFDLEYELLCQRFAGVVHRVNKLVSVLPVKARYSGQIGDVVVGRILDVGQKRWRVDINATQVPRTHE
jgi:hypothetical protein